MRKRTYLVTGGSGFIGTNYLRFLFEKYGDSIHVINLDKLTYAGNEGNLQKEKQKADYTFIKGDICDRSLVQEIFQSYEIHRVIHFAAESHVDRSILAPEAFVRTNVLGTQILLECSKRAWETGDDVYKEDRRFLHVSTDEVFGSLEKEGTFSESSPYCPRSPYAASKAGADLLVKSYIDTYAFPANLTNCGNNYGPYQHPEKLIPRIISHVVRGEAVPIYGDGRNVRDWIYVMDHVRALDLITETGLPRKRYNIGAENERENISIARQILSLLGQMRPELGVDEDLIVYVSDRKGHDRRYAVDPGKIRTELSWRPAVSFEEGLRRTVEWYLEHEVWMRQMEDRGKRR